MHHLHCFLSSWHFSFGGNIFKYGDKIISFINSTSVLNNVLSSICLKAAYYYLDDGPPTTPPLNQPAWDGGEPPTHSNMTIIIDDDFACAFGDGKNKEFGVNAKGRRSAFSFLAITVS